MALEEERTMGHRKCAALVFVGVLLSAGLAHGEMDEDEYPGELRVRLTNYTYPRVAVDGEEWDSVEFEKNGKTVIVLDLDRSKEILEVTLTPSQELAPATLKVRGREFKRKRKGRVLYFVANRKVTFKKASGTPKPRAPAPVPDEEPKKPRPAAPPDDDL